jgi:hypothetical protein
VLALEHPPRRREEGVMDGTGGSGIDRRTIIKRAAAGGALAWTAPVILDSLESPAGAITCTSPCLRAQFPPSETSFCDLRSQTVVFSCTPTSPECPTTTSLGPGVAIRDVCMFANPPCGPKSSPISFQLDLTCDSAFSPAPRRFLAAQALYATVAGSQACVAALILGTGSDLAAFVAPADFDHWVFFQFLIGCTCS